MARKSSRQLEGMSADPRDWRIEDIEKVCCDEGITCSPPKRGDHYKISHPSQVEILTVPAKRPILPVYVRKLIGFVERVRESRDGE